MNNHKLNDFLDYQIITILNKVITSKKMEMAT